MNVDKEADFQAGSTLTMPCMHLQAMEEPPRKVTFFPVMDGGKLVGLVTLHSLVSAGL
jgi:hypothetical protein